MHMAVYPTLPYVPSGFYEDKWCKCDWCSKWGMSLWPPVLPAGVLSLIDIDGLGYLCDACYDLAEPPWYPNARQRCAQSLERVMPESLRGNPTVLATISAFVVWNDAWRLRWWTPCCTQFCYQRHNYFFPCRQGCLCSLFWDDMRLEKLLFGSYLKQFN